MSLDRVRAVFETAGTGRDLSLDTVTELCGLGYAVTAAYCSKLLARGLLVRPRRGIYRLATGVEQLEHLARISDANAPGPDAPTPPSSRDEKRESIRAEVREELIERVRSATRSTGTQSSRDWLDGFDAGVEHVASVLLDEGRRSDRVRRVG